MRGSNIKREMLTINQLTNAGELVKYVSEKPKISAKFKFR